jgi:spore germination protein YaaH
MKFDYTDMNGARHEVWYADAKTLFLWRQAAEKKGVKSFAYWRAGGNLESTLKQMVKDVGES